MYEDLKFPDNDENPHHDHHDFETEENREDILEATVGSFGRWQFLISFCMAMLKLPIAWIQLGIVFLAPPTDFWCKSPEDYKMYTKEKWVELIRPGNASMFEGNSGKCVMRDIEDPTNTLPLTPCKWGFDYDRSIFTSNIISEWNLVCGKEHFVDLTQSVLMFGILVGSTLFGALADKYGRKNILIICIVIQAFSGFLSAWSPWIGLFLALRFLMAMANGGTMIVSFVLCMEVVGGKWRHIVPILYQIPFGLGNTIMALVAYYFRTWREFQITLSLLSGIFIVYAWIIPESPRWLLTMDRRKEACKVLEDAAEMNNIDIMRIRSRFLDMRRFKKPETNPGFTALVKTPTLRMRTIILTSSWFMSGLTLYGFTQYLGHVGSNIYFNVSVGGLIIIPGTLLCVLIISKCGRKWTILSTNIFIALCFIAILLVPSNSYDHDWPKVMFAALGVIGLSVATPTLYLFTGELYPTVVRNVGVGACITFSRVGSMISPFVVSTGVSTPILPLIILAACAIVQSVLVLPLNDSGNTLADTISDVETGTSGDGGKLSHDDCLYGAVPDENLIIH